MATIMRLSSLITQTQSILQTNSEISRKEVVMDTLLKGFKGVTIGGETMENTNITDNVIKRDREMNDKMNREDLEYNKEQEWNSTLQNEGDANSFEKMTVPEFPFQIYSGNRPGQPIENLAVRQPSNSEQAASNLSLDNYYISDLHLRNERDHHRGSTWTLPSYNIDDMHLRNERNDGDSRSLQNYNISDLHTRQDRCGPHASRLSLQDYHINDMHLRNERCSNDDSISLNNFNISDLHTREGRSGPPASRSSLQDYHINDTHLKYEQSKSHNDLKLNEGSRNTEIFTRENTRQLVAPTSLVRPRCQQDKGLQPILEHSEYEPTRSKARNSRMRENQHTYTPSFAGSYTPDNRNFNYNNNTNPWTRIREFREGLRQVYSLSLWEKAELLKQGEIDETDLFNSEKQELGPSKLEHCLRQGRITNQFRNVRRVDAFDEPEEEHEIITQYHTETKRADLPEIPGELMFRLDRIRRNLSYVGLRTDEKELLFCHGHLEFNEFTRFDILDVIYREKQRDPTLEISEEDEPGLRLLIEGHVARLSIPKSREEDSPRLTRRTNEGAHSKKKMHVLADTPLISTPANARLNFQQDNNQRSNSYPTSSAGNVDYLGGANLGDQQCDELCYAIAVTNIDTIIMHREGLCCGQRRLAADAQICPIAARILVQVYKKRLTTASLMCWQGWANILVCNENKEKMKDKLVRAYQVFKRNGMLQQILHKYSTHACMACSTPDIPVLPEVKRAAGNVNDKSNHNNQNLIDISKVKGGPARGDSANTVLTNSMDDAVIKTAIPVTGIKFTKSEVEPTIRKTKETVKPSPNLENEHSRERSQKINHNLPDPGKGNSGEKGKAPSKPKEELKHNSKTDGPTTLGRMNTVGLANPGNYCYMNSALQMLRSVPEFLNAVLNTEVAMNDPTDIGVIDVGAREFRLRMLDPEIRSIAEQEWVWHDYSVVLSNIQNLYQVMDSCYDHSIVDPLPIWNVRANVVPRFHKGYQEDSSEYLENLLKRLYLPFQVNAENGEMLTPDCPFKQFKSVSMTRNECRYCHTVRPNQEFSAVTVFGIDVNHRDIQSGLDSLFRTSLIREYHCETAGCRAFAPTKYPMANSSVVLKELPDYFFAKLKKFTFINDDEVKLEVNILCNKEVIIPAYMESMKECKTARYAVAGVIRHSSTEDYEPEPGSLSLVPVATSSAYRGHYKYLNIEDGLRSTLYNDSVVVGPYKTTESMLSKDAYIVLYKLVEIVSELKPSVNDTMNSAELTEDDLRRTEDDSFLNYEIPDPCSNSDFDKWDTPNDNNEGKHGDKPDKEIHANVEGGTSDNGVTLNETGNTNNVLDGHAVPIDRARNLQVSKGVIMVKEAVLEQEEVLSILKEVVENPDSYHVRVTPPYNVKNGEVYLYKLQQDGDRDYLRDMVTRFHDKGGRETTKSEIIKKFFYLKVGNKPIPGVVKHVYSLKKDYKKRDSIVLIHYIGDNSHFISLPHGNDKKGRNFVTPIQSVKDKIKKLVKGKGKPKDIYQDLTREERELLGEDFDTRGSVFVPRNSKQLKNFRARNIQEQRLAKDEIVGLTTMSYLPAGNFLHEVHLKPLRVVVANPHVIDFAKNVLRESYRKHKTLKQLLSYDTTFELADAYVSVLVMRNIYMQGDPIFPVGYLIHRNKHESGHRVFWDVMTEKLELQKYYSRIPIITDKEAGIRLAIRKTVAGVSLFLCHNHMIKDIERWLRKQGGIGSTVTGICTQIRTLLDVDNETDWDLFYDESFNKWSPSFREYIQQYKYQDLKFNSKFNYKNVPAFADCLPTTNTSESENARMKRFFGRQELLLDALALGLNELQSRFLFDFHLSFGNECGDHTPKKEYRNFSNRISLPGVEALDAEKFSKLLKDQLSKDENAEYGELSKLNCVSLGGAIIAKKGLVKYVPDMECYLVKTDISNTTNIVKRNNSKVRYECNCDAKGICMHIYAVYETLQEPLPEKYKRTWTLNALKHIRKLSGRSGRKKEKKHVPRFGAKEYNIVEAPDSIDAKSEKPVLEPEFLDEEAEMEYIAGLIDSSGNPIYNPTTIQDEDDEVLLIEIDPSSSDEHQPNHSTPNPTPAGDKRKRMISPSPSLIVDEIEWLSITHIETGIWTVIRNACAESFVTSSPVEMCTYAKKKDYGRMIQIAARFKMLDRDIILQPMNDELDSNKKGGHWMLGGVLVQYNVLFLMDSLMTSVERRMEHFHVLYRLAAAAAASGRLLLKPHEWNFVYVSDCEQQANGHDCGIFTVLYANAIAKQQNLLATSGEIQDCRKWFNNIVRQKDSPAKRKPEWYPGVRIPQECMGNYVKAMSTSIPSTTPYYGSIAKELELIKERLQSNWSTCEAHHCLMDETHSQVHNMCVGCRKWLHEDCEEVKRFAYPSLPDYTYCTSCWQWFDRVELGHGRLPSEIVPPFTGWDLSNLTGDVKGIEWENNSSPMDVAIATLLHTSDSFDNALLTDSLSDNGVQRQYKTELRSVVNTLRSRGFCSSATMFEFRKIVSKLWKKKGCVPVMEEVIAGLQKYTGCDNFYMENTGNGGLVFNTSKYGDSERATARELVLKALQTRNVKLSAINTSLLIKMPWNSSGEPEYGQIIPNLQMNVNNLFLSLAGLILLYNQDYHAIFKCGDTWLVMKQNQAEELSVPEVGIKKYEGLMAIPQVQSITDFEKHLTNASSTTTLRGLPPFIKNILQNIYICVYKQLEHGVE